MAAIYNIIPLNHQDLMNHLCGIPCKDPSHAERHYLPAAFCSGFMAGEGEGYCKDLIIEEGTGAFAIVHIGRAALCVSGGIDLQQANLGSNRLLELYMSDLRAGYGLHVAKGVVREITLNQVPELLRRESIIAKTAPNELKAERQPLSPPSLSARQDVEETLEDDDWEIIGPSDLDEDYVILTWPEKKQVAEKATSMKKR